MSNQHMHWHRHPHPPQKKNVGKHHHPYTKAQRKGKPKSRYAHDHAIGGTYRRLEPPEPSTPRIKALWRAVYTWFPGARSLGIFNCRRISGSSSWSQHAYADAWDVCTEQSVKGGRPEPQLDAIVSFLRNKARPLNVTRVIYRDSDHQNHAHVDVNPDRTGTPECA